MRPAVFFSRRSKAIPNKAALFGLKALLYNGFSQCASDCHSYEWGFTYGPPMAVAPLDKVRQVVAYGVTEIPPQKILMGLPNYGYDWLLPFEKGVTRATSIGNQYAVEIAAKNRASIRFDETAQSPYFEYWDLLGRKHVVWFEDVRSMQAKFQLMDEYSLLGGGYWNLMRPFNQNWGLLAARYEIRKNVS